MPELTPHQIAQGLTYFVVLLFSLSFHESAHAWAAHKLGDDTAKDEGRVSLNPIVHIDPIGTLLFPLLQIFTGAPLIGWAKPTPYNPANFNREVSLRRGHILVAAAGPGSNALLAVLFAAAFVILVRAGLSTGAAAPLASVARVGIELNVMLALFNFIPIPPLDGSKVASFGLPGDLGERYDRLIGPNGFLILVILMVSGAFAYLYVPVLVAIRGVLYWLIQ